MVKGHTNHASTCCRQPQNWSRLTKVCQLSRRIDVVVGRFPKYSKQNGQETGLFKIMEHWKHWWMNCDELCFPASSIQSIVGVLLVHIDVLGMDMCQHYFQEMNDAQIDKCPYPMGFLYPMGSCIDQPTTCVGPGGWHHHPATPLPPVGLMSSMFESVVILEQPFTVTGDRLSKNLELLLKLRWSWQSTIQLPWSLLKLPSIGHFL